MHLALTFLLTALALPCNAAEPPRRPVHTYSIVARDAARLAAARAHRKP